MNFTHSLCFVWHTGRFRSNFTHSLYFLWHTGRFSLNCIHFFDRVQAFVHSDTYSMYYIFHNSDTVSYRKGINYAKYDEIIEILHVS